MAMRGGNAGNLKPLGSDARTMDEQREIQRKGGAASGAARRRRRDMKARLLLLLSAKPTEAQLEKLAAYGLDADSADMMDVICASIVQRAADGNINALQLLANLTGDDPYVKARQAEVKVRRDELKLKREELEHKKRMDEARMERDAESVDLAAQWVEAVIGPCVNDTGEDERSAAHSAGSR